MKRIQAREKISFKKISLNVSKGITVRVLRDECDMEYSKMGSFHVVHNRELCFILDTLYIV